MNKAVELIKELEKEDCKFWSKRGNQCKIQLFQLINFLSNFLKLCKAKVYQQSYLAIKDGNIIELITIETASHKLVTLIEDMFPEKLLTTKRVEILDALIEKSTTFWNTKILNYLPIYDIPVNTDTLQTTQLFYKNGILNIDNDEKWFIPYNEQNNYILRTNIICRNIDLSIKRVSKSEMFQFTWNLAKQCPQRFKALCSILGYLAHRFKNPANPKMIILIDQIIGEIELASGGSGKSLFLKSLSFIRNTIEIAGKTFRSNNRFAFQRVDIWTDIVLINDLCRNENLENFYNVLADGFVMEKKYEKEQYIPYEYSFKLCATTNHLIKQPEGNSSERRKHEIEVSDHYGKEFTPYQDFGHQLYSDWDTLEWNRFDNFMIFCIQYYLKFGLINPPKINILKRKLIAEVGIELIEFMDQKIEQGITKFHKKDTYDEFVKGGYVNRKYIPQRNSFTRKLKKYFEYKEIRYNETPSDTKRYFEIKKDEEIQKESIKTHKDFDLNYKLVDTKNKRTRLLKTLKDA